MRVIAYMVTATAAFIMGLMAGETWTQRKVNTAEMQCLADWSESLEKDIAMLQELQQQLLELTYNGAREDSQTVERF